MSKLVPHSPEMTTEEIAKELGVSYGSINSTLKRAMKKLKDGRAVRLQELAVARERERMPKFRIVGTE